MSGETLLDRIEVVAGVPMVKGVPVETIVRLYAVGMSVEDILRRFPQLAEDDVRAAITFYTPRCLGCDGCY